MQRGLKLVQTGLRSGHDEVASQRHLGKPALEMRMKTCGKRTGIEPVVGIEVFQARRRDDLTVQSQLEKLTR